MKRRSALLCEPCPADSARQSGAVAFRPFSLVRQASERGIEVSSPKRGHRLIQSNFACRQDLFAQGVDTAASANSLAAFTHHWYPEMYRRNLTALHLRRVYRLNWRGRRQPIGDRRSGPGACHFTSCEGPLSPTSQQRVDLGRQIPEALAVDGARVHKSDSNLVLRMLPRRAPPSRRDPLLHDLLNAAESPRLRIRSDLLHFTYGG